MRITFNNYKGFLIDDGEADHLIDYKDHLTIIPPSNSLAKSKKKTKKDNTGTEYRTNGFDLLNIAWELCGDRSETRSQNGDTEWLRIEQYGELLRSLCCKYSGNSTNTRNDDLSSHQTLYGDTILNMEDQDTSNEVEIEGGKKGKKGQTKLSPDQRKEKRRQLKEMKAAARDAKKQKKNENSANFRDTEEEVNLTTSRSKINYLKSLAQKCISEAKLQSEEELKEMSRIYQIDDVSVYVSDVRNLLDDEWLSDSNIGWIYAFLYHAYILPLLSPKLTNSKFNQYEDEKQVFNSPICLLLPTFTFLIANHPDPKDLVEAKVLPSGISDAQFVFCSLNDNDDFGASEGGSHWSLVVFVKLLSNGHSNKTYTQQALVFDSMFEANASETNQLVSNMAQILHNPKDPKSSLNWDIVHVRDSPQQTNGSDCGVFVASVTAFLISELITLVQSPPNSAIDFSLSKLRFSATDSRIWMLGTLLNLLKTQS